MARIARVVAPGIPYHSTQRGNRRREALFYAEDGMLHRRCRERTGRPLGRRAIPRGSRESVRPAATARKFRVQLGSNS